ncbi:hypothetical protein DRN63_03600 [Nanoarchaeota archaeon]|nr:MAG: hypothetical protein DRN63_03600 [Nanoarchaeota archaeon]
MDVISLLDISLKDLLGGIEKEMGIELPKRIVSVSLNQGVLHIRFTYPRTGESDAEPLLLKILTFLFRDAELGEVTALEIMDIDEALKKLEMINATCKR